MKKSLIALAALASVSAFAQTAAPAAPVTVYGLIDISYMKDTSAASPYSDGLLLNDRNSSSRVGLKGSVDAGAGIKANYNLEAGHILISAKPVGEALFNRQAWAGLSGAFGEVRAGTQDSVGFQTNIGYDLNGAANDSQASLLAGVPTVGNGARTLAQYITPEFAGFKAQLGYQPKGDNVALVDSTGGAQASYAAAVSYAKGPLSATVSYESATTTTVVANSSVSNNWSAVSASYDFGIAKLVGTAANGGSGFKGYNLGVAVPYAGATFGIQYANNTDTKDSGVELLANKEVLKNTTAYLDLGKKHIDGSTTTSGLNTGDYYVYSLGLIWTF